MNQLEINGEEIVFGLDIGTRNVVGTLGYKNGDRFIVIAQEIRKHHTRAMLDGQIHDISKVAETIRDIKETLEAKTGFPLREVCIAAAGRVLRTMNVHAEHKLEKERNVTKEDMNTLISIGVEQAFSEFQNNKDTDTHFYCVGYSVIKYYLNGVWISQLEHHKARKISADMIATFLPDDVVDGLYSSVELAGLEVSGLTLEPIAAIRVAIPEKFRLLNIAMIDIGAGTSDISITNDGSVIAFGMIPHAGDSLTEALARACLIDFATAEQVKTTASEQEEIVYEDIMGTKQTITAEDVLKICQPEINKMAHLTAEEIRKLNGGVSPSAVFIVGGGGKIKGLTEKVAEELGLDNSRVALRGEEIMKDIEFPKEAIKDSTIITPIGICLTHYDQSNNFIYVTFNGTKIKLYDNNRLTVMDAAMQASFKREALFGKKGKDLRYTLNGIRHSIRGEFGESAQVYVNGENVNFNYPIRSNDKIKIEPSTVGKSGSLKLSDIEEYSNRIEVTINGDKMALPVLAKVNGDYKTGDYKVKTNDKIEMPCDYTLGKVVEYLGLTPESLAMTLNGNQADVNYKVNANDAIELNEKASIHNYFNRNKNFTSESSANEANVFKNMTQNEKSLNDLDGFSDGDKLLVIVNDKPIVMTGKSSYSFVDVFDYIDFDTSKMQGHGIATIVNGKDAQYTQPLHVGDKIEIYWKN